MGDLKKIRIDYYWYRFRKGRAEILLEKNEETSIHCVPFHYVTTEDNIIGRLSKGNLEDDGDIVLIEHDIKPWKMNVVDKEWISLDRIKDLNLLRDETPHITCNIYRFFLHLCPCEKEPGLRHRVEDWLDEVKTKEAKRRYRAKLQSILDGNLPVLLDAFFVKNPDPELVHKEMETLEHFCIHKPKSESVSMRDDLYDKEDAYYFDPIDLRKLGAEIEYVNLLPDDENLTEVIDKGRSAFDEIKAKALRGELSDFTLEEINEEIRKMREGK